MDVLKATKETLELWKTSCVLGEPKTELSLEHCENMFKRMSNENFSYGKLCRWLGWIQAACIADTEYTLEVMKQINLRNK